VTAGVYEGRDGWLLLTGGSNAIGALYDRNADLLPDEKLRQWADLIEARARRFERMNIQYVHVNVPEKLTIYDNKLYEPIIDWTLSPAMRLGELLQRSEYASVWLDLIDPLRAARDRQELYYKTDTHWNAAGCFLAYELVCGKLGLSPDATLLDRNRQELEAILDLGMKMEPPVSERVRFYDFCRHSSRTYSNVIAKYLDTVTANALVHVGSHVRYQNSAPAVSAKKILIFGDSYASQRPDALTGMLAETARQVEFVWSSNLDWAYIRRSRPDVVIYELAERFMTIVPTDRLSLRRVVARQALKAKWLEFKSRRKVRPT
jgi:alginate O-acetyltransferase complex protein AlgJ